MAKLNSGTRVYGNLTVDTNLTVSGTTTLGNLVIPSPGNIQIGTQYTSHTNAPLDVSIAANSFVQINIQNIDSVGTLNSADFVATAPDGTDSTKFIDMGINGNNFVSSAWTMSGKNDGYVYIDGGNLTLGTATAGKTVSIHVGGTLASSVVTTFNTSNVTISGNLTVNGNVVTVGNMTVTGSILPSANVTYDLGSPTRRWRSAYFSGNTIYLGDAVLTSSGTDIIMPSTGALGVPVGTTAQRTATLGALRFNTDTTTFEAYDGATWNSLAYGSVSDFPSGDYGDVTTITADAFGVASATTFDCNGEGATSTTDLGVLT